MVTAQLENPLIWIKELSENKGTRLGLTGAKEGANLKYDIVYASTHTQVEYARVFFLALKMRDSSSILIVN